MKCHFKYLDEKRRRCIYCKQVVVGTDPPYRIERECPKPRGEQTRTINLVCVHRGEPMRIIDCEICGRRGQQEQVFACAIHGECTVRKAVRTTHGGMKNCLSCENFAES